MYIDVDVVVDVMICVFSFSFMDDFSFLDLVKAYVMCRKRKRSTYNAVEFEFNLENNLIKLYEDLKSKTVVVDVTVSPKTK